MCLPLCFLKKVVQFESWLVFIISILAIIIAIIVTIAEKGLIDNIHNIGYLEDLESFGIAVAFWVFAGTVFVLSLTGICGAKHKNKCLLAIFNMGNICLFLAFLSLGIASYFIAKDFKKDSSCKDLNGSVDQLYAKAEQILCKEGCQCYFTGDVTEINNQRKNTIVSYTNDAKISDKTSVQACGSEDFQKDYALQAKGFQWLEEKFECSGWCTPYPIKLFSDVNEKIKKKDYTCYLGAYDYAHDISVSFGNVLMIIAGVLGLLVLLTCCLCFHPSNDKKSTNYYTRMAYYDD